MLDIMGREVSSTVHYRGSAELMSSAQHTEGQRCAVQRGAVQDSASAL
jgi:hypothetical protein